MTSLKTNIRIKAQPLGHYRASISTLDMNDGGKPVEQSFTSDWRTAAKERNRRFERWCENAELQPGPAEVYAESMEIPY